jgi:hypothetical protein
MKNIFDLATALLLEQATRGEFLAAGRLMSPSQVAAATRADRQLPEHMKHGWFLCGNLHPRMFALAEKSGVHEHWSKCRVAPSGRTYLLLAQRVDDWQHRFVLPLVGEQMRRYLADLDCQPLRMSLANGNMGKTLVESCDALGQDVVPGDAVVTDLPKNLPGLGLEIQLMTALLLHPAALAGPGPTASPRVCVSLVMSDELFDILDAALEQYSGSFLH